MQDPVAPLHGRRFYVFGPFRLDPANRLLLRDGQTVPLTAKVFDLLLYLVEHSDRLLTKDEILENVWRDSFVEEGNVARHVSMLRKALDEGPRDHAYVVTVSGRGYRFVAHVSTVTDRDGWKGAELRAVTTSARPIERLRRTWLAVATAVVAATALLSAYLVWPSPSASPSGPLSLEWRTNTGDVYGPAISRDGTRLAYIWIAPDQGGQGVRVRQVAGGNTIDVIPPGQVTYWGLRFSPRGDYLYYLVADRLSNASGTLYRVPTLGGRSERVLENVNGHIAPSPDGKTVAIVRFNAAPGAAAILIVGAAGGPARELLRLEWPVVVQAVEWAPDGTSVLCALRRRTADGDRWHVVEVPAEGGASRVILPPRPSKIIAAAWLPGRRGFLMTAVDPASGLSQLWRVSYPEGREERLTDDLHDYKDLTVTDDGRTIVSQSLGHLQQLWITAGGDVSQARHIASGTLNGAYDALAWTADSQLLYKWGERGLYEIWRMAPDGSAQRQLTAGAKGIADTSVSRDGRFIYYVSTVSGSAQIWRMRPGGEDAVQLTHHKSLVSNPVASPDGRWVYFTADDRGFLSLWKMTIDGQSIAEISAQPIELFDLSPDGRSLAYSYRDPDRQCVRVTVAALDNAGPAKTFDIEPIFQLRWTPDGTGLAFTHGQGNVWIQPLAGGSPYPLTRQHPGFRAVTFAWSPDARYLAYTVMANPVDAIAFKLQ